MRDNGLVICTDQILHTHGQRDMGLLSTFLPLFNKLDLLFIYRFKVRGVYTVTTIPKS